MIKLMVNVNILAKMDKNMMGNGSKDWNMDMVCISGRMEGDIKGNIKQIKGMVKGLCIMEGGIRDIRGDGKMGLNMGKEFINLIRRRWMEYGRGVSLVRYLNDMYM